MHGVKVEAGEEVVTLLGAANRDPRVFDHPECFDVARVGTPPMSFGAGIHYCLGASLARAEGHVVFDRLLETLPGHRTGMERRAASLSRLDGPPRPRIAAGARRVVSAGRADPRRRALFALGRGGAKSSSDVHGDEG